MGSSLLHMATKQGDNQLALQLDRVGRYCDGA